MSQHLSIGLLAAIASLAASCGQATPSDEEWDPSGSSQTLSEDRGGQVGVEIRVNHNPAISAMSAEWLGSNRQRLSAQVADRDGDALSFAWSVDCRGSLDDARATQPVFTYEHPLPAACTIHLDVDDGQGGTHAGDLTLSLSPAAVVVQSE